MRYKTFGRHSGLRVSELALGTGNFGTAWGYGAEPAEARKMFARYLEAGGNFIDTADNYQAGQSETLLSELIRPVREQIVLASKYTLGPNPQQAGPISRWTKAYWEAVHPHNQNGGQGGGYVNFMMDDEGEGRIRATYGDNYDRLVTIKAKYDPDNLFRVNQNIRPLH